MRVLSPDAAGTGRTRTMTTRLVALRPSPTDLLDASFLLVLVLLGLLGFATSFDSARYLILGLLGTVLGLLLAHLSNVLRWHWTVPLLAAAAFYLVLGGALAVPDGLLAGFIPSLATFSALISLLIGGWKELLTTLAPLPGDSAQVALVYLIGLVAGAAGFSVARRSRSTWTAAVVPFLVLAASILLGTHEPAAVLAQGLGFAAIAFGWLTVRAQRRRRLVGTGAANLVRVGLGVGVLVVAIGGGFLLGPAIGGGQPDRVILRSYVQPPVELPSYTSPLVGFPKYSSDVPERKRYYDEELVSMSSSAPVRLLRFEVLDSYSGIAWSATAGGGGSAMTAFQRMGSSLPNQPSGDIVEAKLTIAGAYAAIPELAPWVPSIGQAKAISFAGDDAASHLRSFRFNLSTGQGLVPDSLRAGDQVLLSGAPTPEIGEGELVSGGTPALSTSDSEFIAGYLGKLIPDTKASPGAQLRQAMAAMSNGYFSDGTKPKELNHASGHDQRRLAAFLADDDLIGSDEQYAATLGLVAARLGFPSRVVFGAVVPADGVVRGKDVHAWVEVQLEGGTWAAIPPSSFIPTRSPDEIQQKKNRDAAPTIVPPPNPIRPPSTFESWFEFDPGLLSSGSGWDRFLQVLLLILRWAGPPITVLALIVGGILGAKTLRRRRRRTRGAVTARIAGGWREAVDYARDLGHRVPLAATRQEQVLALGRAELVDLAALADRAIFGPGDPSEESVDAYWEQVAAVRTQLSHTVGRWRRWVARLNVRTFLPPRLAERADGLRFSALPWRRDAGEVTP